MLFKLSNLNSNLALTLGYLNPALNNSAMVLVYFAVMALVLIMQLATSVKHKKSLTRVRALASYLFVEAAVTPAITLTA